MAHATRPLRTIGDLHDKGYALAVSCSNRFCRREPRGGWLDLEALIAARGRDLTVIRLRELLRCQACGEPGGISIISDGRPAAG